MGLLDGWLTVIARNSDGTWTIDLFDRDVTEPYNSFSLTKRANRQEAITASFQRWPFAEIHVKENGEIRPVDLFVDFS